MKKIIVIIFSLILFCLPINIKAEENVNAENTSETSENDWILGIGILAAGGFAYMGNKLGKKLGNNNKKKK